MNEQIELDPELLDLQLKYVELSASLNVSVWTQLITINGILLSVISIIITLNPTQPYLISSFLFPIAIILSTIVMWFLLSCLISYRDTCIELTEHLNITDENERCKAILNNIPKAKAKYIKHNLYEKIGKYVMVFNLFVIFIATASHIKFTLPKYILELFGYGR